MEKTQLFCKGYIGACEFSAEDNVWHGKIENITDLITFQTDYFDNVWAAFSEAVDDYLVLCDELNKKPCGRMILERDNDNCNLPVVMPMLRKLHADLEIDIDGLSNKEMGNISDIVEMCHAISEDYWTYRRDL